MKTKRFFMVLGMALTALCLTGCGDDDENGPNGGGTEQEVDYTATTSVKEVKLKGSDERGVAIYEDFNYKLELMYNGELTIFVYKRLNGVWSPDRYYRDGSDGTKGGFVDMGMCSGIQEVTSKDIEPGRNFIFETNYPGGPIVTISYYHCAVQPSHGYAVFFTTENDEVKYLRIYLKSYTLDGEGTLSSVTVQYQLY